MKPGPLNLRLTTLHQPEDLDHRLIVQYAISRAFAESDTVEEALPRVLEELGTQFGWQFGAFWLLDDERQRMRAAAIWRSRAYPEFEAATRANSFGRGRGIPGLVWQTGEPIWKSDVSEVDPWPRHVAAKRQALRGVFAFPVVTVQPRGEAPDSVNGLAQRRTDVIGVVELYSERAEPHDEQILTAMAAIGLQLGVFLANRRAHDAERIERIRNAAVVEIALDCIITIDHDGRILEWNPAAERTFGHPRSAVLGRQLAETIIPPQYREAHYRGFARYRQTGDAHILVSASRSKGCARMARCSPSSSRSRAFRFRGSRCSRPTCAT
jgi:PAS domain S-box-containing protein